MPEQKLADELSQALHDLSSWFATEQVAYTSIGGIAVSLVAQPRVTQDIDAVIWLDDSRWQAFLSSGEGFGVVPRISEPLEFARRNRVLLLEHQPTGISIDLSCGALPFEQEMIERAMTIEIGQTTIKVATPEDLVVMKAVANRPKDLADIASIISTNDKLDQERIRYWVAQFAEVLEMPEIAENVERQLQTQKPASQRRGKKTQSKRKK